RRHESRQSRGEADSAQRRGRPGAVSTAAARHVARQGRAHGGGACRCRRRMGKLLGVADLRPEGRFFRRGVAMIPIASALRRWPRLLATVLLAATASVALQAHEIGTTRVTVSIDREPRYRVEIVTDAAALLEKLEAANGQTVQAGATPAQIGNRLTALDA